MIGASTMTEHSPEDGADRGALAELIERVYPEANGWYLADLILDAGFIRVTPPGVNQ